MELKPEIVDVRTLARKYLLSPQTIRRWVKERKIPHLKVNSRIRFNVSEIEEWMRRE